MGFAMRQSMMMEEIECCRCGMFFAVPENWERRRRELHDDFYCPNGHPLVFSGESAAEKIARLEREVLAAQSAKRFAESRLIDEQARTAKEMKRVMRRANAGVCQHCHRTFSNMTRHMQTKHGEHLPATGTIAKTEAQTTTERRVMKTECGCWANLECVVENDDCQYPALLYKNRQLEAWVDYKDEVIASQSETIARQFQQYSEESKEQQATISRLTAELSELQAKYDALLQTTLRRLARIRVGDGRREWVSG